jgi:hypothetical protein
VREISTLSYRRSQGISAIVEDAATLAAVVTGAQEVHAVRWQQRLADRGSTTT